MAIKLVMSKAYNSVDWNFLELVMRTMGTGGQVRKLIMFCACSVTFSF